MRVFPAIEVLTDVGPDRQRWLDVWALCGREPFANPDYVRLLGMPGDLPQLLVSQGTAGVEILPVALRPLDALVWISGSDWCDASSPYGYGGPYAESKPAYGTWGGLSKLFGELRVVTWFGRLALGTPVIPNSAETSALCASALPFGAHESGSTIVETGAENVVVALEHSAADQWRRYAPKVRKNVNKALRAGLRVRVSRRFNDLEEFTTLYAATMDRRGAAAWYKFDRAFFSALTATLPDGYLAAEVRDSTGRLVSAELVLMSDRRVYSFLGGTYPEAFQNAPNDLLKHAVINHARELGCIEYVLGGGLTAQDGIFRFKRAFDHEGVVPFHRVKMVLDKPNYIRLVDQRSQFEQEKTPNGGLQGNYFPAYRAGWVPRLEAD